MAASAFGGSARRGTRHRGAAPIGRGRAGAANGRLAFLGLALVGGFGAVEGLAFREVAVWLRAFVRYGAGFFFFAVVERCRRGGYPQLSVGAFVVEVFVGARGGGSVWTLKYDFLFFVFLFAMAWVVGAGRLFCLERLRVSRRRKRRGGWVVGAGRLLCLEKLRESRRRKRRGVLVVGAGRLLCLERLRESKRRKRRGGWVVGAGRLLCLERLGASKRRKRRGVLGVGADRLLCLERLRASKRRRRRWGKGRRGGPTFVPGEA